MLFCAFLGISLIRRLSQGLLAQKFTSRIGDQTDILNEQLYSRIVTAVPGFDYEIHPGFKHCGDLNNCLILVRQRVTQTYLVKLIDKGSQYALK